MRYQQRRLGLFMLTAAVSLSVMGATMPLNPLVTRTPQRGQVSPECAEGVAPAPVPRVEVRDIPLLPPAIEPAALPAPPTGSLRGALEETQKALTRNDRPAFDANLAEARTLLEDYPSGAQRRSAEELVRIYDATARLWDAQYESPFLSEASAESAQLRGYPGYETAVRRSTLTRDGQRWFPAGESRDFLGRVAAERLHGIGIQAPAPRLARNETPSRPTSSSVARRTPRVPRTPVSTSARATARPSRSAAPSRPRLAGTSTPPAPAAPPSAPPSAAAAPPPADVRADVPADVPAPEPTITEPTTSAAEPTASAPETSAPTVSAPAEPAPTATEPSRTRSVVLPTILILIGLGVLILLFRASK